MKKGVHSGVLNTFEDNQSAVMPTEYSISTQVRYYQ